jgi:general secretion pathway protein M
MNKNLIKIQETGQALLTKVQKIPAIIAGKQWFSRQSIRDQKIIKALLGFVVICLIIVTFIQPFYSQKPLHQAKLNKSIATYEQLASNAHKFQGKGNSSSSTPILAVITQQAKIAEINLKRFEPDNDNLRIWLDNESFDDAARWLETLTRDHGIKVKQISVERSEKNGRVDLRATLYK